MNDDLCQESLNVRRYGLPIFKKALLFQMLQYTEGLLFLNVKIEPERAMEKFATALNSYSYTSYSDVSKKVLTLMEDILRQRLQKLRK